MTDGWQKTERGWRKVYRAPSPPAASSDFPCPRVISDVMEPLEHVDSKFYDSKSAFRAVTKAHGLIEVGNDPARHRRAKAKSDPAARRRAIEKAAAKHGI